MKNYDKLPLVAKIVWDNLPFDNTDFKPESVYHCEKALLALLKKDELSWGWVDSVCDALENGWPIYVNLDKEWNWNFLTMRNPKATREDILREIGRINFKKIKVTGRR